MKKQHSPVYNETFAFEDFPTLDNMEVNVKLVDDNVGGADDKIDPCLIKLQRLDLDTISTEIRRKIDNNIFSRCAYSILKNLYGIWRGISCR